MDSSRALVLFLLNLAFVPCIGQEQKDRSQIRETKRVDSYGDPLPPGAVVRFGTLRFRHLSTVNLLVFTPDGKAIVSAGMAEVVFWDLATGKPIRRLPIPPGDASDPVWGPVECMAFSPDGRYLAIHSCVTDSHVWDLKNDRYLGRIRGPRWLLFQTFCSDNQTLAFGSAEGILEWWDVKQSKLRQRLQLPDKKYAVLALSPDGTVVAGMPEHSPISLFEATTGKALRRLDGSDQPSINQLAFSSDSRTLASGSNDTILLWSTPTGRLLRRLPGKTWSSCSMALSPSGASVIASDEHGYLRLWEVQTGKPTWRLPIVSPGTNCVAYSPDGKTVATLECGRSVLLWDAATGKQLQSRMGQFGSVKAVALSRDGTTLAAGSFALQLWNLSKAELACQLPASGHSSTCLAYSPDGRLLASGGFDFQGGNRIHLWDVRTGKEVRSLQGHKNSIQCLAWAPNGRMLVSVCADRNICLWDVNSGTLQRRLYLSEREIRAILFSSDGKNLILGGEDGIIRVWEIATGKERFRILADEVLADRVMTVRSSRHFAVHCLAISPNGKMLAVGLSYGFILVWQISALSERSQHPNHRFEGSEGCVRNLAFSPDSNSLAAATEPGATGKSGIRVWELRSSKERVFLDCDAQAIAFSATGERLISGNEDTTVLVWDLTELSQLSTPQGSLRPAPSEARCWDELADGDAATAFRASGFLKTIPKQAVSLLAERLHLVSPVSEDRLARLIGELDHNHFRVREKAFQELEALGDAASTILRQTLERHPSLNLRRRVELLLVRVEGPLAPERLRTLRSIELLEQIATPEARKVLSKLAQGSRSMLETEEARAALERLDRR